MNTDIVEGNKLIAGFMGLYVFPNGSICIGELKEGQTMAAFCNYDRDWNQLMPVVEKIGKMPFAKGNGWTEEDYIRKMAFPYPRTFGVLNTNNKYMVRLNACPLFEADTLIEATWLAVVDYIKFDIEQKIDWKNKTGYSGIL